jgi:7-cyano-7-deazaguanine reductase
MIKKTDAQPARKDEVAALTLLGAGKTTYPQTVDPALLETFPNQFPERPYLVTFQSDEFTSLCPVTGQPDFGKITIAYVPAARCIESKSLKLYLGSFRNHGAFHEDCTLAIADRLVAFLTPRWLRIGGYWYPRGGMPIDVFWQTGRPPAGLWLPDQGVPPYRGRG